MPSGNGGNLGSESISQNVTTGMVMILKKICTITFNISLKTLGGFKFLIYSTQKVKLLANKHTQKLNTKIWEKIY
jgi:hypothetical protein